MDLRPGPREAHAEMGIAVGFSLPGTVSVGTFLRLASEASTRPSCSWHHKHVVLSLQGWRGRYPKGWGGGLFLFLYILWPIRLYLSVFFGIRDGGQCPLLAQDGPVLARVLDLSCERRAS